MSEGKDRYEERRRLENENALLREERENRRLKSDAELEGCAVVIAKGLRDLFEGKAWLSIEPCNVGNIVRFQREGQ